METNYQTRSSAIHFDTSAKTFIPSKQFNPFDLSTVEDKQVNKDEEDNDPEMEELSHHYLNSNLLEDETPEPEKVLKKEYVAKDEGFVVWQQPEKEKVEWKSTSQQDIWKEEKQNVWNSFEPYSRGNDEFDPTLQFHHGALYDSSIIQDMNLLKDNCPSSEEIQVENVGEDMSTLQMLQTIFSDLSEAKLLDTLEKNDYDMDRSIESLLAKQVDIEPVVDTKKRQVCRHFLAGECYRKDCWFVHDLQEKVCKFWLQGSCLKGDLCEFSHNIDIKEMMINKINSNKPTKSSSMPLNMNEYPELGTVKKTSTVPLKKTANVEEEFPSLASAVKMKSSPQKTTVKTINFAEAIKKKSTSTGQATRQVKKKQYIGQRANLHKLKQPVHIPWLETGNSLNSTYMKEREKAIEYGTLRNRLFAKATEYYLKGDGSRAKLYSMEAKHYNRLMQEMHMDASRRIFEQRSKHEAFIDLHGLHQDEAIDIIDERLYAMRNNHYTGLVYIVTGTGHHSGDNGLSKKSSKLKPYIEEYLQYENYCFAETHMMGDTKGGIFAVDLSSKK